MPYGPVRKTPKERALTNKERDERIRRLQQEQEARLRRALGDNLFNWIEEFEQDVDVLNENLD